jgi:hypothetical protein
MFLRSFEGEEEASRFLKHAPPLSLFPEAGARIIPAGKRSYGISKYMSHQEVMRHFCSLPEASGPVHCASWAVAIEEKK